MPNTEPVPRFTLEEIRTYLEAQDSFGDIFYYLSEDNIRKAVEEAEFDQEEEENQV